MKQCESLGCSSIRLVMLTPCRTVPGYCEPICPPNLAEVCHTHRESKTSRAMAPNAPTKAGCRRPSQGTLGYQDNQSRPRSYSSKPATACSRQLRQLPLCWLLSHFWGSAHGRYLGGGLPPIPWKQGNILCRLAISSGSCLPACVRLKPGSTLQMGTFLHRAAQLPHGRQRSGKEPTSEATAPGQGVEVL